MNNSIMKLIWMIIPLILFGIVGIQYAEATQCTSSFVQIEEFTIGDKDAPKWGSVNDPKPNPEDTILKS